MSSSEDWYPLAPADLQTSSDDELPKHQARAGLDASPELSGAGKADPAFAEALVTPSRLDVRHVASPRSSDPHSGESPRVQFDEQLDELDGLAGTAQERWQRTDAYMRDVQSAFRTRPAVRVQSSERFMKLLMVGEPGLGKDLFVKNVFAPYCSDNDLPVSSCSDEVDPAAFLTCAPEFCTEVVVEVDNARTKIHYLIQDTPGTHSAGADTAILKHILKQNQEYMAREEDPRRVVPMSTLPDPRVDVCLYFLSPHFFKPQDVALMTRLSELVPVVPIIAKADALTMTELDEYRDHVRERLQNVSLQVGRPVMYNFSAADLKSVGAVREVPPFAVITSTEVDHEVGSHWFTRTFPWGRCEVMSSNHSDLPALKSLLFEACFEGLKAATEARFYSARESALTSRALSRALSGSEAVADALKTGSDSGRASTSHARSPKARSHPTARPQLRDTPFHAVSRRAGAQSWGWSAGLGLALGVVTLAVLLQVATLRAHGKSTAHLRSLVESYQRDAAHEKQVIADLIRALEMP